MSDTELYEEVTKARSSMPRVFREKRQRSRAGGDSKSQKSFGGEEMESVVDNSDINASGSPWNPHLDRTTLCLPSFQKSSIVHGGDDGFQDVLKQYFPVAESNATELLLDLKCRLRLASNKEFWTILLEEMCNITGSQCGFVAKRILVNDQDSAVEMPELGEPGSCLMGIGFYLNDGKNISEMHHDYSWHAYGTPCAHMRHDKVFIVPERLKEIVPDNPNKMPFHSEAFIGVPLFAEGKCFAHFGMLWSSEGALRRRLGWTYIEMFMHSLEDMIVQRILEGNGLPKEVQGSDPTVSKVIPIAAITVAQSLQPYARNLSHELRTPMQGVVGMLDIMHATVLDAITTQPDAKIFQDLKRDIEAVQHSSKRAVEAADNVVHAYDMNLKMPEGPDMPKELRSGNRTPLVRSPFGKTSPERSFDFKSPLSSKRSHSDVFCDDERAQKKMFSTIEADVFRIYCSDETATCTTAMLAKPNIERANGNSDESRSPVPDVVLSNSLHRRVVVRDFLRSLVNETLRNSHPTEQTHAGTELGEKIEIKTIGSRGEFQERIIHLEVASNVPEVVIMEEQHLRFSLQKIIDNAIKFTESGSIHVTVGLGKYEDKIEVWVVDTGCGIDEESKQFLFTPHFQQDSGISRARDGLGLSLFNAKAHIRKNLGGDVTLERSDTEGPTKGSEFLIRLPMSTMDLENDTPIVGTPPTPDRQSSRPPFWAGCNISPEVHRQMSRPQSVVVSDNSSPLPKQAKTSTRKRAAFNPNLAKDYPLNILIAEDNPINRNVAIGSLSKLGYSNTNITVAFDGLEAVQQYKDSLSKPPQDRFNAILMDLWMPNMDGYEATTNIKEIAKTVGELPVTIAVTADITSESVERAKVVGMEGFLAKPYKVLDIERLIKEHFPRRAREAL